MAAESLEFEFPIKASVQLLVCYALAFLFEELESPPPPYYKAIAAERVLLKQDEYNEETLVSMETGGTPTHLRLAEGKTTVELYYMN
ncbi:hypothetical protein LSH36_437g00020 [Paralvinella palmiformis]|uniref:Uncharacterized protein n=1 Tax=Paralvinella palmiformis TaxID=53620 RepID=A0AAD9JBQ8_9ANNE|nr:hypothetical protein LSH36_437g00020 [Paralvinella palmiformis]